jgi:ABC-type multidrug transport system fused ATPase/permease subunit
MFGLVGIVLYQVLNKKAARLGLRQAEVSIKSQELITQVLTSYREIFVKSRRAYFGEKISKTRFELAESTAEMAFLQNVSKYVLEITIVVGTMVVAGIQFSLQSGAHAVTVLSIFLAASTRIAPAVMRIQQGLVQIKGNIGSGSPTLKLIQDLELQAVVNDQKPGKEKELRDFIHQGFIPEICLENLSFNYAQANEEMFENASLKIIPGTLTAIVGESGSGKTTLADLMLGLLEPSSGSVSISGLKPSDSLRKWPGAIAYVPQEVTIFNGTIQENITLGFDNFDESSARIEKAIELASLSELISQLPDGLDSQVGDRGTSLSGGQRQRIGIARALFTNPMLLIMDEATSSLDGITESIISNNISMLHGKVTVVLIAHRLSTVKNADHVVYLKNCKIVATGSFNEIRIKVPDFDKQAKLMGL